MEIISLKYSVIEELMKINKPEIILRLKEYLYQISNSNQNLKNPIEKFAGIWTEKEAAEFESSIEDCNTINHNEW